MGTSRENHRFNQRISSILWKPCVHKSIFCDVLCLFINMSISWRIKTNCSAIRMNRIGIRIKANSLKKMLHTLLINWLIYSLCGLIFFLLFVVLLLLLEFCPHFFHQLTQLLILTYCFSSGKNR